MEQNTDRLAKQGAQGFSGPRPSSRPEPTRGEAGRRAGRRGRSCRGTSWRRGRHTRACDGRRAARPASAEAAARAEGPVRPRLPAGPETKPAARTSAHLTVKRWSLTASLNCILLPTNEGERFFCELCSHPLPIFGLSYRTSPYRSVRGIYTLRQLPFFLQSELQTCS